MIHVVAEIRLHPGKTANFLVDFRRLAPEVHAEDGCIEYGATTDTRSGLAAQAPVRHDLVTVIEKWRDVAALDAHLKAPHLAAHRRRTADFVREVRIYVLEGV